jgi:hypothetical protein
MRFYELVQAELPRKVIRSAVGTRFVKKVSSAKNTGSFSSRNLSGTERASPNAEPYSTASHPKRLRSCRWRGRLSVAHHQKDLTDKTVAVQNLSGRGASTWPVVVLKERVERDQRIEHDHGLGLPGLGLAGMVGQLNGDPSASAGGRPR